MTQVATTTCEDRDGGQHLHPILLLAAFGAGAEMFTEMHATELATLYRLITVDLPGFSDTPALSGTTTLEALADFVHDVARQEDARIIVAHSLGSIIASLAARRIGSPVRTILSLEGNITADDAYFSGTAADYPNAAEFRKAFLGRLDELAKDQPVIRRYREIVSRADPKTLWELGCDARRFSNEQIPGEVLCQTENVTYLYNPKNCPESTLQWLRQNPIRTIRLHGATHWKSVDQPKELAEKILEALDHY